TAARHCAVIGCTVLKVGGAGIVVGPGSSFCRVAGNDIAYPGGHAIAMHYDVASPKACHDNVVTNNWAHHCGEITVCSFGWGSGLCISGHRNTVSHNLVHDTAYSALNFDGFDHVIEHNHVHHANLECWDGDGIYGWVNTKGGSGRSVVRFNRVHDVIGFGMVRQGEWRSPIHSLGIRCDDYLSDTTVFGNLVYRCTTANICLHGGWNNTVENNILAGGAESQVRLPNMRRDDPLPSRKGLGEKSPATGPYTMFGNVVRRNIFFDPRGSALAYYGSNFEAQVLNEADGNILWHGARPIRVSVKPAAPEDSWRLWQADGWDAHSLIAAPRFVNPDKDDYRLRPDSPALKMGFQPLPIEQMGLVRSPERASWPVVEPKTLRDPPLLPPPPPSPNLAIARAYKAVNPIRIDGNLEPSEWGALDGSRALVIGKARARVLFDSENLYVAIVSVDKPTDLDLFLQPLTESGPGDALILRRNLGGECMAAASDGRWTGEWQIPFAPHRAAARFRFNIRFRHAGEGQWLSWANVADPTPRRGLFSFRSAIQNPQSKIQNGLLVFDPPLCADAKNLLTNGDFESGVDTPARWTAMERVPGKPDGVSQSAVTAWPREGRDGSRCLKLEALDAAAMKGNEYWWAQTIAAPRPGAYVMTYELRARDIQAQGDGGKFYASGWAKRKPGSQPEGLNLGWSSENHIERGSVPLWTRKECILDVPTDVETLYLLFGLQRATGTVWIDNVRLEKCE
ncbi:MAG: hypothetical protein FJ279_06100, partial [Planctomycetes bacterium]|nr:hypothetical protein [Planctomycetota bacterium]